MSEFEPQQVGRRILTAAANQPFNNPLRARAKVLLTGSMDRLISGVDWRGVLAFTAPLIVYLLTIAPTIYNLDSAELTTAAYTGGLMRATGYPLYLSIGYFWSRLPLGDVGLRMNLFSAVCGAMTIFLADRILRRWQIGGWSALGALGLLALSTYFWGLSLVAEVYTLHTAIMAGFILALLRWSDEPTPARMVWVGLLGGLGLAHHAAMVLLGPASLVYIAISHPRKAVTSRSIVAAAVGTLIGLSPYLYLPLRFQSNPVFNYAGIYDAYLRFSPVDLTTYQGLWWLVSGRSFAGMMMAYHGADLWAEVMHFLSQLGRAFFAVGIGPGLLGIAVLIRRQWREALLLGLMFLFNAGFYINYRVMDKDTMYLPVYLIWALWVALGYQQLLDWLAQIELSKFQRYSQFGFRAAVLSFVLLTAAWNWHIVDLSSDWSTRQRGEAILQHAEANALVFGWWDTVPVVQYLQLVEGQRPDIQAINRFLIRPEDLAQAIRKEVGNRPIYIDSSAKYISTSLLAVPEGPVYRIVTRERRANAKQHQNTLSGGQIINPGR